MSEFVDLYDRNRKLLNRVVDRNTYLFQPGEFMMYVLAILENEEGKFLVTQRALDKKWAAGGWEMPGGGAKSKESSLDAIKREVKEETGLDVRNAEGGYLFTYKRENPGEGDNYFVDVYRFVMDIDESDLHLQTEETDGYMFATVDEIKAFAAEGKFLHYDSIKKAFEM